MCHTVPLKPLPASPAQTLRTRDCRSWLRRGQGGAHDFELEEEEDDGLRGGHPDLQDGTTEIWLFFSLS